MKPKSEVRSILFVCTGNTCRSPMAEGIFRKIARDRGLDIEMSSAGIYAVPGDPVSENAARAAESFDADIAGHRAAPLRAKMLAHADLVLCMTALHAQMLKIRFPQFADKIAAFSKTDIGDPYGGDIALYLKTGEQIHAESERLADRLSGRDQEGGKGT